MSFPEGGEMWCRQLDQCLDQVESGLHRQEEDT